jgi:Raf kinase inhibitor-like YbhB/YbcL family protein
MTEQNTMEFTLRSAFDDGGEIPAEYTCEGIDRSPALTWDGIPDGTKSFALIVDDPDAPDPKAPKMTYVHWVLYNIPADVHELPAGIASNALPHGTREGLNDWDRTGYGGPCPPIGRHRYFFKLYALSALLPDLNTPARKTLEAELRQHLLAQATLMGTYEKTR